MNIILQNPSNKNLLTASNKGLCEGEEVIYPYRNGAFRLVPNNNYTENFGFQWNKFAATQVDTANELSISKNRFFAESKWDAEDLLGKNVLEVGSGAGRFTQVVLDHTKANLHSVDYSHAVEANFKNNGPNSRLNLYQASIYEMPFVPAQFDKVFSFGVLQHTPDVEKSVKKLIEMAKPGGEVIVDFYPIKGWWSKVTAKYIFRPYTKKLSNDKLYGLIDKNIDWLINASQFFSKIGVGKIVNRFLPIVDIKGTLPSYLTKQQLREWCVLDTFDMFSPEYDQPQKISTVIDWFKKNSMTDVWGGIVEYDGFKVALVKGIKK